MWIPELAVQLTVRRNGETTVEHTRSFFQEEEEELLAYPFVRALRRYLEESHHVEAQREVLQFAQQRIDDREKRNKYRLQKTVVKLSLNR